MSDITDYLREKISEVRLARVIGEIIWAIGSCISMAGIFLRLLTFTIPGFSLLLMGLYLSVHYELQRLSYTQALERFAQES
ncbi:MAG: hypothetical protein JSV05_04950 [Candidatus Bathyarchaeota archaeon]|nr:MAG: hypothetical protein JSV05_04950 [Candidatus Bathyarchaeota archaeon]